MAKMIVETFEGGITLEHMQGYEIYTLRAPGERPALYGARPQFILNLYREAAIRRAAPCEPSNGGD